MALISKLRADKELRDHAEEFFKAAETKMSAGELYEAETLFTKAINTFISAGGPVENNHVRAIFRLADALEAQGQESATLRGVGGVILELVG